MLSFNFLPTPFIQKILKKADVLHNLLHYLELTEESWLQMEKYALSERCHQWLQLSNIKADKNLIVKYFVNDIKQKGSFESQCANNYSRAIKLLTSGQNLDIEKIYKVAKLLNLTFYEQEKEVQLREESTLQRDGKTYEACKSDEIENHLAAYCAFYNYKHENLNPILKAWLLYYFFDILMPFNQINISINLLLFNSLLIKNNYNYRGFVFIEKFLFEDLEAHKASVSSSLFGDRFESLLQQNITPFLENAMQITSKNILWIKEWFSDKYLTEIAYSSFDSKKKNSINYFLEQGFEKCFDIIYKLSDRQKDILKDVALNHSVTTKELVQKYRCDRKTIQRDFNEILDKEIIAQEGKTKTTRYKLNFGFKSKSTHLELVQENSWLNYLEI